MLCLLRVCDRQYLGRDVDPREFSFLKANLETKKAVSLLMIAQMCFACFVAHGLHSPLHMSKQYVERLTSEPAVMVICMGQAVALGLGVLTAGAAAKKSKKK